MASLGAKETLHYFNLTQTSFLMWFVYIFSEALCREPHHTLRRVRVELEEWADKRRAQTAPDISLPNTHYHHEEEEEEEKEKDDTMDERRCMGGSSDDLLRQRRRDVAQELEAHLHAGPSPDNPQREREEDDAGEMRDDVKRREGVGRRKKKKFIKALQHQPVADFITQKGLTNGQKSKESKSTEDGKRGRQEKQKTPQQQGLTNGTEHKTRRQKLSKFTKRRGKRKKESLIKSADFDQVGDRDYTQYTSSSDSDDDDCFTNEVGGANRPEFRSLLLFIPLRLGQEKFNMEYKEAIKVGTYIQLVHIQFINVYDIVHTYCDFVIQYTIMNVCEVKD